MNPMAEYNWFKNLSDKEQLEWVTKDNDLCWMGTFEISSNKVMELCEAIENYNEL